MFNLYSDQNPTFGMTSQRQLLPMRDVLRYQSPFWVLFLAMLLDRLTKYGRRGFRFL